VTRERCEEAQPVHNALAPRKAHPRLVRWWTDDPADPGRLPLATPDVQRLAAEIAPGARLADLGGVMSLNVHLDPAGPPGARGLVLRVHQPFVSRLRLLAAQEVRRRLAAQGLRVPTAMPWRRSTVLRCGKRWAELEEYLPNERLAPTLESHVWLYGAMGTLHRALAKVDVPVPHAVAAPYAPPSSVLRWLSFTEAAVHDDPQATEIARLVRECAQRLRRCWVPASELPVQLVHGDVRLSNVRRTPPGTAPAAGETVYFDFGFLAQRPRIHDLAYALAFMVWALDCLHAPEQFPWQTLPVLIETYEAAAGWRLTPAERRALAPFTAAVPLYYASLDGFTEDPAGKLRTRLPFLHLSDWLLAHTDAVPVGPT
jgi:Ser/Thr protein kinase RdoA (MazF antagonist)